MDTGDLRGLVSLLERRNQLLAEKERELADRNEELSSQQEELTAAIEELDDKNKSLMVALENLKQRNKELDQILYRASHDLRTPVSSIIGLLRLLQSDGLKPSQQSTFLHLQQKTIQMQSLLNSLTMLSQASFDNVELRAVNVSAVVREVERSLSNHENAGLVELQIAIVNEAPVVVDERLLRIVMTVLLANSLSYRPPKVDGKITLSMFREENATVLTVWDDGDGISDQIAERIFEMFYRGSERSTGSGLGLYILQRIVERLGGDVWFKSSPGDTTFFVRFPDRHL